MIFKGSLFLRLGSSRKTFLLIFASLLLVSFVATACDLADVSNYVDDPKIALDPVFRTFVRNLGGEEVTGPVISPVMEDGDKKNSIY